MIFLTGAAGKTGNAILSALSKQGADVLALVRSEEQADKLKNSFKINTVLGDLRDTSSYEKALSSASRIYYICPNVAPDELEIGKNLIQVAMKYQIQRFVYHSVLHPQIEAMPHHWQKLRMEEALFESGLDFTILQPCAYMQNILSGWNTILAGQYVTPYRTSAKISIVDLDDVAEIAAMALTQNRHSSAIYELAGPEPLSQEEVAVILSQQLNKSVLAVSQRAEDWYNNAIQQGLPEFQAAVLQKMFHYYDQHGLVGNSNTLQYLLGREPTSFSHFLQRILKNGESS